MHYVEAVNILSPQSLLQAYGAAAVLIFMFVETGLLIAVGICLVAVGPAIWSQNGDLIRELLTQFMLAAFAAVLSIMERSGRKPKEKTENALELAIAALPSTTRVQAQNRWYTPWRR